MERNAGGDGIGLIGTVTRDFINYQTGLVHQGAGGILYQAAALCGLGHRVHLHGNCGDDLRPEVEGLAAEWPTLRTDGLVSVPQPANQVNLFYPARGERVEILESAVPPLEPESVVEASRGRRALLFTLNSGLEMTRAGWKSGLEAAACPVWLDIHSLVLEPVLGRPRRYRPVADWPSWVRGVKWLQANRREIGCLAGRPGRSASAAEIRAFARRAFALGIAALFVTLGDEGAMVLSPDRADAVAAPAPAGPIVDVTGCGDVFAAAALSRLLEGASPAGAASSAVDLAARAATVCGPRAVYGLAAAARSRP